VLFDGESRRDFECVGCARFKRIAGKIFTHRKFASSRFDFSCGWMIDLLIIINVRENELIFIDVQKKIRIRIYNSYLYITLFNYKY